MVTGSKTSDEERWDKLKSWSNVQEDITHHLQVPEKYDHSMTLYHGPQLYHTLLHPSNIKCMTHFTSSVGEVFATHFRVGTLDQLCVWNLGSRDRDAACTQKRYNVSCEIKVLIYIPKHRVYMGFCSDLQMRMYTDAKSKCQEISAIKCPTTMLSLAYNKDTDEVYVGGIGALEKWKITGSEHSAVAKQGEQFETELDKHEWVIDIKVDEKNKQIMALSFEGIYVINYETMKQTHHLQNRHEGSLKCCCFYKEREYFVTGGGEGQVKVWNSVVFTQVHVFYGHHDAITGLQVHHTDPLLFSCSLDGSVQIWRMDNFSKFMRVDLGDKIHQMKLLGDEEFYCQTEKELRIYSLNQFYNLFAPVESTVYKLQLCPANRRLGKASRVIASTEDGSVRFFSPLTGLAITIIYPMASFQVLTCFAYNREKEKLQTLLENGDVLSFNCTSNPCKAEEVWRPVTPDEAVTQMVLMSVEYITKDNETEYDSVVFGGLKNGQISLLDASKCEMVANVQAHEGIITCMEICTEIDDSGFQIVDTSHTLVTGGDDQTVRLWKINIVAGRKNVIISLAPMLRIKCSNIPNQISMYENTMCVALENPQNKGNLQMYRIEGLDAEEGVTIEYKELSHVEDEDHVEEITAIDKCPLLGLFASASTDGYIKIWNRHNQLIREMVFDESIYGMCFANSRGDILIGFQSHVCSIPLTSYFPQDYLERIVLHQFQDDVRENPIPYNNKIQPWFDPQQLPKFSTGFERRLWEKSFNIKEDKTTLEDLDQQKLKVPSRRRKSEQEAAEQEVRDKLAKLQKLGDIYSGMAEEQSVDQDADEDYEFDIHTERSEIWKEITDMLHVELSRSKEDQMSRTDGKTPPNIDQLTEWERKLLKRKPIIPIDGFIPNSVVRKYLGYTKPMSPRLKFKKGADRWRVKPVPRADPKHMPEGWIPEEEEEYDSYDITTTKQFFDYADSESEKESIHDSTVVEKEIDITQPKRPKRLRARRCDTDLSSNLEADSQFDDDEVIDQDDTANIAKSLIGSQMSLLKPGDELKITKPLTWGDTDEADSRSSSVAPTWKKVGMYVRTTSNLSTTSSKGGQHKAIKRSTPSTPTARYELKSKKFDFGRVDLDLGTPDSSKLRMKSGGPTSRERSKSFRLTNMVVDEDSTNIRFKDGTKSGKRRGLLPAVDMEVVHKLLNEDWFPELHGSPSFDGIISTLMTMLDDTEDLDLHEKVCDYILEIHKEIGIPDVYLERIVSKLSNQLGHSKKNIKHDGLRMLKELGGDRQDVIATILPKLIDSQADIRAEAADILASLTGVKDKNDLLHLMESMGISSTYDSKEDEEEALKALAMRLDIPYRSDSFNDWIGNWVDDISTPGLYEGEDLKLADIDRTWDGRGKRLPPESLCISESNSRASNRIKELSFISDKSGASSEMSIGNFSVSDFGDNEKSNTDKKHQMKAKLDKKSKAKMVKNPKIQINIFPDSDEDTSEQKRNEYIGELLNEYSELRSDHVSELKSETSETRSNLPRQYVFPAVDGVAVDLHEGDWSENLDNGNLEFDVESVRTSDSESFSSVELSNGVKDRTEKSRKHSKVTSEKLNSVHRKEKKLKNKSKFESDKHVTTADSGNVMRNDLPKNKNMKSEKGIPGWTPDTQASGRRQKSFYGKELSRDAVVKEGRLDSRDSSRKGKVSSSVSKVEISRTSTAISDEIDGFDPRDPMLYKYYNDRFQRQVRPQSGKILQGGTLEGKEDGIQDIPSKFTDSMDVNSMTSSQDFPETVSSQFGDGMSTQDSGIGRDMSEISSHWKEFGPGKLVPIMASGQPGKPVSHIRIMGRPSKHRRQQLSPVKSTSTMSDVSLSPVLSKPKVLDYDWQKFFETPTALERKRLEKVRKDFSKGNLKSAELPTIRYIADGLPTLPGEAGLRLLHTIKVQEKGTLMEEEGRHRIQSIPGKLQVHTKDANTGMSRFGILQMKWTTGVPYSVTKEYDDISSKSGTCTPTSIASTITARSSMSKLDASRLNSLPSVKKGHKLKAKKIKSDDSILPNIHGNGPYSPDFEWEHPLPPPPAKDSRTNVAYIKKQHDSYCKYYSLAKKNMQRDISRRELGLPNVIVKHALSKTSLPPPPVLQKSLSKLSQTHSIIFPPITLAQLINT